MKTNEEYSKMIDDFMLSVAKYVEETQGSVPAEYQISFMMLRNNLTYYLKLYDTVVDEGMLYASKDGRQFIQPCWTAMKDCEKSINEILKQFGLTTMSRSKIKMNDTGLNAEQLLQSLVDN